MPELAPSVFATLPGAIVVPDGPDAGAVWHFGNPIGEQRALEDGRALVELARGVITVAGPDRLSWLNSITSQNLLGLREGDSSETLVLDPSGRIEHAVRVVEDGARLWLIVDRAEATGLLDFLQKMRFMLRVEIADVTDAYAVVGSTAPLFALQALRTAPVVEEAASAAVSKPSSAGFETPVPGSSAGGGFRTVVWHDPWSHVALGGHQYAGDDHDYSAWSWFETIVTREFAAGLAQRAASELVAVAGAAAAEALRIAARRPRFATEVDERSIPHELDWLRSAVHLNKGCYRGQETIAKVHNLGHPPRRLVLLHLDGSDAVLPGSGAEVMQGDAVVGQVTSSALHHELGPIALAVVKRSVDPAAALVVRADGGDIAAAQEVIVPPSAGAEADVPRLPRLGAVTRRPRDAAE
ncbi:YgfZ/GcvT domain-containing protein [Gryllotalpicola protaetiae]|uniref:Folate-binding protein n=1 Tax=Gryllotalpicola protaetiae TaxID=2419771 RepID=A0A387BPG5_9MICO|nr:glycine cleavage T C-terminal barrel domain-containing protein [Gryllotalpicola protaetiae]AYG02846.1 folate-binding protein [Gryllotalpicola protaetiae]